MNEWEWIDLLRARASSPAGVIGIGDDCAVLPGGWIVSSDAFVEGVHFRPEWDSWAGIGRKAAEAAKSDIAAMGGEARYMLATLSTAKGDDCARGLLEGLLASGIPLVGGDTTSAKAGSTTLSLTVIGFTDHPVLRSGARPGDRVAVSGPLGGALGGLRSLERGLGIKTLEDRFLHPRARLDLASSWGKTAGAMIDISDGLSSELNHLARASNARIEIDSERIPVFAGLAALGEDPLALALAGGDEYELLATCRTSLPSGIEIGRVVEGDGVFIDGRPLPATGWTHWS